MGFVVVSKSVNELKKHKVFSKRIIKSGRIDYTDGSGKEATFTYTERIKYNNEEIVLPLDRSSLCIIGRKYCYCYNRFDPVTPGKLVKYIPEDKFERHSYNCYKYKPGSIIEAAIEGGKAYGINKRRVKKHIEG